MISYIVYSDYDDDADNDNGDYNCDFVYDYDCY